LKLASELKHKPNDASVLHKMSIRQARSSAGMHECMTL